MSGSENTRDWRERTIAVKAEGQRPSSIGLANRVAQDLDALAEKIDVQADIVGQLGASFHAQSDRLSTQSQDMAALRKRIEALETEAQGVGSSHCVDCGKAWSVVQVCCDQGVSGEGRHVLGRCVTCCPCRFKTKAPASTAPPAPLVESQIESIATEITEAVYRLSVDRYDDTYRWPGCIAMRETIEPILVSRLSRAKEAAR